MFRIFATYLLLSLAVSSVVFSANPDWWTDPSTAILDASDPATIAENYSPANLGQLKHVAKQAKAHLDENLPGGAGEGIAALIMGFGNNLTAAERESNYAPINLGQLKAVAKPFYDRLASFQYDTKSNLIQRGYPSSWNSIYPWTPNTPASENYSPANIGQIKMVFSFDLSALPGQLPIWWQKYYFNGATGVSPEGDPDGDGLSNIEEFYWRLNPSIADSDDDGMSAQYELANGLNPLIDDTLLDLDGDLIANGEDARPNDGDFGRVTVSISAPIDGGNYP